jgi:septal ring factor EnvC (AmiA/AmiB activator)
MNKTIVTAAIAGVAILSPVAAMSVTPVRDALLGLAPEEQIVTLADEIDKSRVDNEQKLTELQELISTQQKTIDEQKKALDTQKYAQDSNAEELIKQKADQTALASKVSNQAECLELYRKNPFCSSSNSDYEKSLERRLSTCEIQAKISKEGGESFNKDKCIQEAQDKVDERQSICASIIEKCG